MKKEMTQLEALDKVAELGRTVGEGYVSVREEYTQHKDGEIVRRCEVYMNGTDIFKGETFEEAIELLSKSMIKNLYKNLNALRKMK
jgi:hypothetical protein